MGKPTEFAPGLHASIEIMEWRKREFSVPGYMGMTNVQAIAGIDNALAFLKAAASRADNGDDYRSTSTTEAK